MDQVTAIRLQTATSAYFDLPWYGADEDERYVVKSADGLGPTEMTAGNRVPADREIVLLVGLYPDYAVEVVADVRQELYRILSPWVNTDITVQLMNGVGVVGSVGGRVTKFEIAPFTKDPAVQITIECERGKPYFEGPDSFLDTHTFGGAEPTKFTVDNVGSAPTGLTLEMTLNAGTSNITIAKDVLGNVKFELVYAFLSGDIVQICTTFGERYARVVRGGVTTNLLHLVTPGSVWHQLHYGANDFYVNPTTFSDFDSVHQPMYQGV